MMKQISFLKKDLNGSHLKKETLQQLRSVVNGGGHDNYETTVYEQKKRLTPSSC